MISQLQRIRYTNLMKKVNTKNKALYDLVKKELDIFDAYALLSQGCPNDEFEHEAELITNKINKGLTEKEIAKIMVEVYESQFNEKFQEKGFIKHAKVIKEYFDNN